MRQQQPSTGNYSFNSTELLFYKTAQSALYRKSDNRVVRDIIESRHAEQLDYIILQLGTIGNKQTNNDNNHKNVNNNIVPCVHVSVSHLLYVNQDSMVGHENNCKIPNNPIPANNQQWMYMHCPT